MQHHYGLYACVPDDIVMAVKVIRSRLHDVLRKSTPDMVFCEAAEAAHFTVLYGPKLADGRKEALTPQEARLVYPYAVGWPVNRVPTCFRGVSHFIRPGKILIHLEFHNSELTRLHETLRAHMPDVEADYSKWHQEFRFYDQSYAPNPKRWLHIAIGSIQDRDAKHLVLIEDTLRDLADELIPSQFSIKALQLISAVTDTPVSLDA